ncbi:MAG: protein kinase domain-containing protein [Terriglobales bacterium]
MILTAGQSVHGEASRLDCTVKQFLGGGGQGEVYRAQLADRAVALKWYLPHAATEQQRFRLTTIVKKGPPTTQFLWPGELASAARTAGFGYIMPLREPRFRGIAELMRQKLDPSFRTLATMAFELAHNFLQLHSKGLCYRDISFGNVFFDPANGEILICDNDNVTVDGDPATGILGTPRFMAPEIVLRRAVPSIGTDLYSLAVLLFYVFFMHHPLEGRREAEIHSFDLAAMTRLFGSAPLFIFDPEDDSNRPVPGLHDNALTFWPLYPRWFRDLFTQAFTVGITDPAQGRVRETQWRAAAITLRDAIYYCPQCGSESFYDAAAAPTACWQCGAAPQLPYRLQFPRRAVSIVVMLNHDTRLYPHHLDPARPYDFSEPAAAVAAHPSQPGVWGLKNLSSDPWTFRPASDTAPRTVAPGASCTLTAGAVIQFGKAEACIAHEACALGERTTRAAQSGAGGQP